MAKNTADTDTTDADTDTDDEDFTPQTLMEAYEDSLEDDSYGRVTAKEIRSMVRQMAGDGPDRLPDWVIIQMMFVPVLRRVLNDYGDSDFSDPNDRPGPRICSFVLVLLKEIVRTNPPLPEKDEIGFGTNSEWHEQDDRTPMTVTEALTLLAQYYSMGVFHKPDRDKMLDYCQQASDCGGFDATLHLAQYYEHGSEDTLPDYDKAFAYYNLAYLSEPLIPAARFGLASLYFEGRGVEKDEKLAVSVFRELENDMDRQDNPWMHSIQNKEALYSALYNAYRLGRGVKKSPLTALEYAYKIETIHRQTLSSSDMPQERLSAMIGLRDINKRIAQIHEELDSDPTAASL